MDFFSSLDHTEREREERLSGSRALIAAKARCRQQFGAFLANAGSDAEREARLAMLPVGDVVTAACEEYGCTAIDDMIAKVAAHLLVACSECGCDCKGGSCSCSDCSTCGGGHDKEAAAHADGCECSFPVCVRKREESGKNDEAETDSPSDSFFESRVHEAADTDTDDSFQQERVDLPAADWSGLGGPSPKMDKGTWTGLDPIDIGSKQHRLERQDPTDRADYTKGPFTDQDGVGGYTSDQPSYTKEPVIEHGADIDKAMPQKGGPHTDVFPNRNQADPVTSSWRVVG